jgi:hypothetical protein
MPTLAELQYKAPDQLMRFVGPQAEKKQKLAAARGTLPLPPKDLVQILFALTLEADSEINQLAGRSLVKMPENILKTVCEDRNSHPLILNFLARNLTPESGLQEVLALNRTTHDETIVHQAGYTIKRLVDIISENQIRILRCPDIVDSLSENPITGQAQLERIIKFVELETKRTAKKAPTGEGMEVEIEKTEEDQALVGEAQQDEVPTVTEDEDDISAVTIDDEGASAWAKMTFDSDLLKDHHTETDEEEEELEINLHKKIQKMKVSEKIKLALMGGSAARSMLIKDTNKMVSTAAMKNPRITDSEIEGYSRSRSLNDDVIRMIAGSREWTRSYSVKLNLVHNPKCPLPDAMRFMNFLRDKDIRELSRSKSVSSQVATQAKRMLQRKEQKGKPGAKH